MVRADELVLLIPLLSLPWSTTLAMVTLIRMKTFLFSFFSWQVLEFHLCVCWDSHTSWFLTFVLSEKSIPLVGYTYCISLVLLGEYCGEWIRLLIYAWGHLVDILFRHISQALTIDIGLYYLFFSCGISLWFCYQGNIGLRKSVAKGVMPLLFCTKTSEVLILF